jgi:hypothetical protein
VITAILKGSAVMVPVAVVTAVLINELRPSDPVIALILLAVCAMVAPLAIVFDPENRPRKH